MFFLLIVVSKFQGQCISANKRWIGRKKANIDVKNDYECLRLSKLEKDITGFTFQRAGWVGGLCHIYWGDVTAGNKWQKFHCSKLQKISVEDSVPVVVLREYKGGCVDKDGGVEEIGIGKKVGNHEVKNRG